MPKPTVVPLTIGISKEPKGIRRSAYSQDQKFYKLKNFKDAPEDSVLYVPQESYVVIENANSPFSFVTTDGAGPCAAIAITGNGKTFFTHLDDDSSDLGKVKDSLHGMISKMLDMVSLDHSKIESISVSSGQLEVGGNTMAKALLEDIKARDNLGTVDKPCTLSSHGTNNNLTLDLAKMETVCCKQPPFPAVEAKVEEQIVNKNVVPLSLEKDISKKLEELKKYKFPDDVESELVTTGKTITIMEDVKKAEANQQNNNANVISDNENEDENNESNEESSSLNNDLIDAGGNENSSDISQGSKHATTGSNSENINTGNNVTPTEPKDVNEEEELELVESK